MANIHQKFIVIVLVVLLGTGAAINAAAGVESCLPKSCCCSIDTPQMMDHQNWMAELQGCSPKAPAPCCKVEPYQPTTDLAFTSPPNSVPHRVLQAGTIGIGRDFTPEQPHFTFKPFSNDGRSKIPWIPIWLQTLSIL
ncbi:MAG: hypothetical protein PVI54_16750 [Desulfobacteraceae bacterium]|jgi:hypothetical protein